MIPPWFDSLFCYRTRSYNGQSRPSMEARRRVQPGALPRAPPDLHSFIRLSGEMAYYSPSTLFCAPDRFSKTCQAVVVDPEGFEPSTSSMPLRRAPNCAMGPSCQPVDLEGFEPSTSSVRLRRAPNCATGPTCWRLYLTGKGLSRKFPRARRNGGTRPVRLPVFILAQKGCAALKALEEAARAAARRGQIE